MSYPIGLTSVSFRDRTPEEILQAMQSAGLTLIEWGSDVHAPQTDTETLRRLATMQAEYGITCCSYGTYFRLGVTPIEELTDYVQAAKILGTDVLRLWCGNKNSEDYTPEEKAALFADCRAAAKIGEDNGVTFCMECHNKTYTNVKDSALELMQSINSPHFRMYWQPNQFRTEQENLDYADLLSSYTVHIHAFNWRGKEKLPLRDAVGIWREYLSHFDGKRPLLLEFMPDGKIETLPAETDALKEIAR